MLTIIYPFLSKDCLKETNDCNEGFVSFEFLKAQQIPQKIVSYFAQWINVRTQVVRG